MLAGITPVAAESRSFTLGTSMYNIYFAVDSTLTTDPRMYAQ